MQGPWFFRASHLSWGSKLNGSSFSVTLKSEIKARPVSWSGGEYLEQAVHVSGPKLPSIT